MTSQRENADGNPPSGRENPELPGPVVFTPRINDDKGIRWEIKPRGTKGHGIARALESLRGVRLSLVPRSNRGERLLRAM